MLVQVNSGMTTGPVAEARILIDISNEHEPSGGCFSCPQSPFDLR